MSKTFAPFFKISLKQTFDFRGKKQNASMITIFIVVLLAGLAFSSLYSFIFVMAALEAQTKVINVLYAMSGFASLLALTTTIPKVKVTLFGGNDYDMLAALPIPKREILFVKFFSLYLIEFFYTFIIIIPACIISFIFDQNIIYFIHTAVMLFLIPIFPLLIACLVGTLISIISDRTRFGNIITMFFYAIFLIVIMCSSMVTSSSSTASMDPLFDVFKWFNPMNMLLELDIPVVNYLAYVGTNLVLLVIVILLLTLFYDHIHVLLTTAKSNKKFVQKEAKVNKLSRALLKIELKRYFTSKGYLMNTITGGIMCVVMVGMLLFTLIGGEETDPEFINVIKSLIPYFSLLIMWCIGISTPAASGISIEGKNMWIIKTLPINYKQYLNAKIILSEIVLAPFVLVASTILFVFSNMSVESIILIYLVPQMYLLSLTYISLILNTRFYKLQWANELEVVKNSKSIIFAMLIDFAYTLIMCGVVIALGIIFGLLVAAIAALVVTGIVLVIAVNVLNKKCPSRIEKLEI